MFHSSVRKSADSFGAVSENSSRQREELEFEPETEEHLCFVIPGATPRLSVQTRWQRVSWLCWTIALLSTAATRSAGVADEPPQRPSSETRFALERGDVVAFVGGS